MIESVKLSNILINGFESEAYDNVVHRKTLPYMSVVESVTGSYSIRIDGSETYETGTCGFFIAPSQKEQIITHHIDKKEKKMKARWIFFEATINDGYPLDALYDFPVLCRRKEEMHEIFNKVFSSKNEFERYTQVMHIIDILTEIGEKRPEIPADMSAVLLHIRDSYMLPITVEQLTGIAHMSPSNFYRSFKNTFGMSPIVYLNRYRLGQACVLLENSANSISEISRLVGFDDPLYFSRVFKKEYGIPPKEYRNVIKNAY